MGTTYFIGAILLEEGYAVKTKNIAEIKFFKTRAIIYLCICINI